MAEKNLINCVLEDHKLAKDRLDRFLERPESSREDDFHDLARMLLAHEAAEEMVVYPAFHRAVPSGDPVAEVRIAEQDATAALISEMERLSVADARFSALFSDLRSSVLEHARLEEATVLEPLRANSSEGTLTQLGEDYARAKASAPVHPRHDAKRADDDDDDSDLGVADQARAAIQDALAPETQASR
jgi:Hemerythrin HHE cation binding domain